MGQGNKKIKIIIFLICLLSIFIILLSFFIGSYYLPPDVIVQLIIKKITREDISSVENTILFDIRLPRIILALLVGCAISLSSACFQATFRNPLVSEYILGVSAGAAFGASLSIAFLGKEFPVQPVAFLFGTFAVSLTYFLARIKGETPILTLVLSGVVVTAIFTAGNYIIRYIVEPEKLHAIVVWIMGSLSAASWRDVFYSAPLVIIGSIFLISMRWRLNILSMGEEEAKTLGVNVERLRIIIILLATLITSIAISTVGIIGWIGLIVPHIVRMLAVSDNRIVLPLSAILGGVMLLLADNLVRMSKGIELPVGVLTTLVGAPAFIYLIRKTKGSWE